MFGTNLKKQGKQVLFGLKLAPDSTASTSSILLMDVMIGNASNVISFDVVSLDRPLQLKHWHSFENFKLRI